MNQISIFNLNCWLFPTPLSSDSSIRLSKILDMINEYSPDIITLQEVWSNKHLNFLKQKLPKYFSTSSKTLFYNQSGLVIFIKQHPAFQKVNFFKLSLDQNFTEWFLHKGYISIDFELGNKKFTLINTHLYAPFSKSTKNIPEEQLELVADLTLKENTIICGDFNLEEEKVEKILGQKFVRICNSEPTSDGKSPYSYKRFNKYMSHQSKKIDYIFFKNTTPVKFDYRLIKNPFVSDHYPMFCKIIL